MLKYCKQLSPEEFKKLSPQCMKVVERNMKKDGEARPSKYEPRQESPFLPAKCQLRGESS